MNRTRRRGVVPNSGRLPRLNLASNPADDESSRTVGVVVKRSCRNPVDTAQVSAYGSVFYANGYRDGNSDGWVVMQTISGVVEGGGGEVIAVVPPGKYPSGSSVAVEARYLADKPPGLDWEHGAVLPFQAITCLCPLLGMGLGEASARGKSFVVTGGHGSLAPFIMGILKAWGGFVCCVTTRNEGAVRALGADLALDFRKASFSEEVDEISVVVDTLGREKDGSQRMLKEIRGAGYVSLQPKVLKVAIEEGVLFGAGKIMQYQSTMAKDDARTYFMPNAEAMGVVSRVAEMVGSSSVELEGVGTQYIGMQEYAEALAWPKDAETGLRYGFPAKTRRSWGWLEGGDYDDDGQYAFEDEPWEDEEDDDEDEDSDDDEQEQVEGPGWAGVLGQTGTGVGGGGLETTVVEQAAAVQPAGKVVPVKSREELRALAGKGGAICFVSSRSCRACKYLSPFYRKLARKQQFLWFGHIDATAHPELAHELGTKAVPAFVTFRGGELVTSATTSNKKKIEQLVEALLLE